MKKALFAGSFDPFTVGHLDLTRRSLSFVDTLYIGIAKNIYKSSSAFSLKERQEMIESEVADLGVKVVILEGMVADFVKQHDIGVLIRGVRGFTDFELEATLALANRQLAEVETVWLMPSASLQHVHSKLVRELIHFKHDIRPFVPEKIAHWIEEKCYS